MSGIKVEVDPKLMRKLSKLKDASGIIAVVKDNGADLQQRMQRKADEAFTKGYATGQTSRSIGVEIVDGGKTAFVGAQTEYAPYLEHGTRFMDAEPFVHPAAKEQGKKFEKELIKLLKES